MKNKPHIKKSTRTEYSAGGIVFRKLKRGIEIAFLLDPFDKWTFAKGHIDPGETSALAAMREVREELGIEKVAIIAPLGKVDWRFREQRGNAHSQRGVLVHKFVDYYLMQVPYQTQLHPQKSEMLKDARWVPLEQAFEFSDYKDIEPVLKKAIDILRRVC